MNISWLLSKCLSQRCTEGMWKVFQSSAEERRMAKSSCGPAPATNALPRAPPMFSLLKSACVFRHGWVQMVTLFTLVNGILQNGPVNKVGHHAEKRSWCDKKVIAWFHYFYTDFIHFAGPERV